jgi:hypothetical protein
MNTRHLIFALALAIVVGIPTLAAPRTHRDRQIIGIVQTTNVQVRETDILQADTGVPLSSVWNNRTTFVANMQVTDTSILKSGVKVEVSYHQAFFVRPYVSKIALLATSNRVS